MSSKSPSADPAGMAADFITVFLGQQLFAIPVSSVHDVFTLQSITRVPLAPADVGGVLNLRGRIVTVIDIRGRLGVPRAAPRSEAMAVGIEKAGESYGLIIDEVGEVLTLCQADFEPLPNTVDPKWRAVSNGVYRLQDTLLVVLDVERIVMSERALRIA